jgi:hypothetical protein
MKRLASWIFLLSTLLVAAPAPSQPTRVSENLRHETVAIPAAAPERGLLRMVQSVTFWEGELGTGVVFLYDDAKTKRSLDYIEIYDTEGDLLVVSWIDRFGACQAAMDRGLLDPEDPRIEGVLVIIDVGTKL